MTTKCRLATILLMVSACALSGFGASDCESLSNLKLPDTQVTSAVSVPAGGPVSIRAANGNSQQISDLPAFCRVAVTLAPTSDSDIKVEVWLPATTWNGKFQAVGNGGWAGSIVYTALSDALRQGYAAASTDTGHSGAGGSFALGHREKLIDFGYRAVHEMTVKAKSIIAAYYGQNAKFSYWNGCSTGGRQALMEAQRYPSDFDGIIAGAPANDRTHLTVSGVWVAQAVRATESSFIPPAKFPLIHEAALNACDARDGVKDGVIENPASCKFDPKVLECKAGDAATCLTPPQVEAARKIYGGPVNPRTKQQIFPGLMPGSELGWNTLAGPQPIALHVDAFKYVVFEDPNWDFMKLNFDSDVTRADKTDNGIVNSTDPNLKPFFERGGKLLQYHGWNDPLIAPLSSVNYYNRVVDTVGTAKADASYRLFMVPAMNHCSGGDGTDTWDKVRVLDQWVETGKAPDQITASHLTKGTVDRTRPLCAFPKVATYKGSGSINDAGNFVCR